VVFQGYIPTLASKTELNHVKLPSAQLIVQIRTRMAFLAMKWKVAGTRFEKETFRIHVQHHVRLGDSSLKTGTSQVQIIHQDSYKVPSKYVNIEYGRHATRSGIEYGTS
jgi:hypothetical protein